jgi:hypothetical protein
MREYEFTLKFKVPNPMTDTGMFVDALYESGCDDAIIGTGTKGFIALDFIREAPSAYDAISSAINDVRKAIPQKVSVTHIFFSSWVRKKREEQNAHPPKIN